MRTQQTTVLGWGLLPMAMLLAHCGPGYSTATTDAGTEGGVGTDGGDSGAPADAADGSPAMDSGAEGSTPDGSDGSAAGFAFQPSNITISDIQLRNPGARDEDVTGACSITTDATAPGQSCFTSPIHALMQADGTKVNLIVVKSLKVEAGASIRVTGTVPLVLVSLADITISGNIDAHSEGLSRGPGGAPAAPTNGPGLGVGRGRAASGSAAIGGGGGSYCGYGGLGGGQTMKGMLYGSADNRPLAGGSSGGGGAVGSGQGGGAVQIVAAGTITMPAGSYVTVGGEGGPIGGVATDQNAGGAGSGGAILLEATTVTMSGTLAANGGGGGGDYSGNGGGTATPDATPAPGGAAGPNEAAGGNGSAGALQDGSPGMTGGILNAGGGGGGAGRIRINTSTGAAGMAGTLSPAEATSCATVGQVRATGAGP